MRHYGAGSKRGVTHLLALLVDVDTERRILLLEAVKRTREVGCLLTDGLESKRDDGLRDEHGGLDANKFE